LEIYVKTNGGTIWVGALIGNFFIKGSIDLLLMFAENAHIILELLVLFQIGF
jgi:hypothetical protein